MLNLLMVRQRLELHYTGMKTIVGLRDSAVKTGISRRKCCILIMVVTAQISSVHGKDLCLKKELAKQPASMDFV